MESGGEEPPYDVVFDILTRLPVLFLLQLRSVSKSWNSLISNNSQFINSQLQRTLQDSESPNKLIVYTRKTNSFSYVDTANSGNEWTDLEPPFIKRFDKLDIVCANYGLVLLRVFPQPFCSNIGNTFILWNPLLRKFKVFSCYYVLGTNPGFGIWYDNVSDSYKVVVVSTVWGGVYDVRSGEWTSLEKPVCANLRESRGVFVGGRMWCWGLDRSDEKVGKILCYDVKEGAFREVLHPVECEDRRMFELGLAVWKGRLCVYNCYIARVDGKIWVMEESEKWSELMVIGKIAYGNHLKVVSFGVDGEVVLELCKRRLAVYHPSAFRTNGYWKGIRTIGYWSKGISSWSIVRNVESLVSPFSVGDKTGASKRGDLGGESQTPKKMS